MSGAPTGQLDYFGIAALKTRGLAVAEVTAARLTAAFDAKWGQFVIDPDFFSRLIWEGV
jgi:hypothetical protein